MSLAAGTRVGPYEIAAQIGAGGMGEVYRARDTRLDRLVAIKVIASHLLGDDHARARFERESRAIAALSHPHICTLYDVGSAAGVEFLVMEHLEGETLAARLARQGSRKALPLDETTRIAIQLADALAAAHRAGFVHRDLKPANVMLARPSARQDAPVVKVLDFGLAKLRDEPHGATTQTTTTAAPLTGAGTFVGTLPYMAPEQLNLRETDTRSDLFAFGAIVYEMAGGQRAFTGDSQASLIAAILDRDPEPLASIQPMVPPGLDRLVRKCLAKDPDARWQSASDVADELRWIAAGGGSGSTAPSVRVHRRLSRGVVVAAGLLLAVGAGTGIWNWRRDVRPNSREVQHRQVTFAGDVVAAAISPDGRSVAYGVGEFGTNRVFVRDLTGGQTQPIWTGEWANSIAWLSDGSSVLVGGNDSTWIVPRLGGTPRRAWSRKGFAASSPDGKTLVVTPVNLVGFNVISLEDAAVRRVNLTGFRFSRAIDWHARTNRVVLLTVDDDDVWSIWSVAPDGQDQTRLHASKEPIGAICSSPVSDVLYALPEHDGTSDLVRIPMRVGADSARVLLTGLPVLDSRTSHRCTLSADGRHLLYIPAPKHANLWRLDLAGAEAAPLTEGTRQFALPSVSPDGHWIAASIGHRSHSELVKIPTRGGEPISLGEGTGSAWSTDGQRLAFVSRRGGSPRVWIAVGDAAWPEEVKDSAVGGPVIWLPDGRLAWQTPGSRNYRIRDLRTGQDAYLLKDDSVGWVFTPRFSPRGDQVAVAWNRRSPGPGLWLLSWPDREERKLTSEWMYPIAWSLDGEWIYASPVSGRAVVRVSRQTGKTHRVGQFPVGTLRDSFCDIAPDRSAIICSLMEQKADAWIMENFDPEVRTEGVSGVR